MAREPITGDLKAVRAIWNAPEVKENFAAFREAIAVREASRLDLAEANIPLQTSAGPVLEALADAIAKTKPPKKSDFLNLDGLTLEESKERVWDSIGALGNMLSAIVAGGTKGPIPDPETILRVTLGSDPVEQELRKPFRPVEPPPGVLPDLIPDDVQRLMEKWILNKAFVEFMLAIGRSAQAFQTVQNWLNSVKTIGRIISITPPNACPGMEIVIAYEDLIKIQINTGDVIMLVIPLLGGAFQKTDITTIKNDFITNWQEKGEIRVTLPEKVASGPIGLQYIPVRPQINGYTPGEMAYAAAGYEGMLLDFGYLRLGGAFQRALENIIRIDTAGLVSQQPSGVAAQPDGKNLIRAGAPAITNFSASNTGPLVKQRRIFLTWSVENAEAVEIKADEVAGSPHAHELPPVVANRTNGSIELPINCTRRWTGTYTLRAKNSSGCGEAESIITLYSGYSEYLVGVGKADITMKIAGAGMAGYAWDGQRCGEDGNDTLSARTFIIKPNGPNPGTSAMVFVALDLWICSQIVRRRILERVRTEIASLYAGPESIMICASHTHSGVGGYSEYYLYNYSCGGFDERVTQHIVDGAVSSIKAAASNLVPGTVRWNAGNLNGCGKIRSMTAFLANPENNGVPADIPVDPNEQMTLLKFEKYKDSHSEDLTPIGLLNWFALHPTSLGIHNDQVSGDNKGWASEFLEMELGNGFVAAFMNGAAGDVSGNIGRGIPNGGPLNIPLNETSQSRMNDLAADRLNMQLLARKQADKAKELFNAGGELITGPLQARLDHVDMSKVEIGEEPNRFRTSPAAIGGSFGAGSSEDSFPYVTDLSLVGAAILSVVLPTRGSYLVSTLPEGYKLGDFQAGSAAAAVVGAQLASIMLGNVTFIPFVLIELFALRAIPSSWNALQFTLASILFALGLGDEKTFASKVSNDPNSRMIPGAATNPALRYKWEVPWGPLTEVDPSHGLKPVMFAVGKAKLINLANPSDEIHFPLVPHIVPLQLFKLGNLAIAAVPSEFTVTAGRRLRTALAQTLNTTADKIAIAGYSNGYAGYVTTQEEYNEQEYEGASTLFGPHTLSAYIQEFNKLAQAVVDGTRILAKLDVKAPAITMKSSR